MGKSFYCTVPNPRQKLMWMGWRSDCFYCVQITWLQNEPWERIYSWVFCTYFNGWSLACSFACLAHTLITASWPQMLSGSMWRNAHVMGVHLLLCRHLGVTDFSPQVNAYTLVSYGMQLCFWIKPGGCSWETCIDSQWRTGSGKRGAGIVFYHLDVSLDLCLQVSKCLASLLPEKNDITIPANVGLPTVRPASFEALPTLRLVSTALWDKDERVSKLVYFKSVSSILWWCFDKNMWEPCFPIWITLPSLHAIDGTMGGEDGSESY